MPMKDMQLTAAEMAQRCRPVPMYSEETEGPQYPCGLKVNLGKEDLEKLGIDALPEYGSTMKLSAMVTVCYVSQGDDMMCMGLQITDMELSEPKSETAKADKEVLYADK